MSERFYQLVRSVGGWIFRNASDPHVLHPERAARTGAYLLAANHPSPYDAPLLIAATPRVIYWLSIVEIFRNPFIGWFLRGLGAEPLDREKVDTRTVRAIVRHLRNGRVVGIFPEGGVRHGEESVLSGGTMHDGVCKLAQLAAVPVVPCVVLGGEKFARWQSWLPGARTRWTVAYGEPIFPVEHRDRSQGYREMGNSISQALRTLQAEVAAYV